MKTEITEIHELTIDEEALLDMHTVLNILNVICGELIFLRLTLDDQDMLARSLDRCDVMIRSLYDSETALARLREVSNLEQFVFEDIEDALEQCCGAAENPIAQDSLENLQLIFEIFGERAMEILSRSEKPDAWQAYDTEALKETVVRVLKAIERNSKGGFTICYSLDDKGPCQYTVLIDISAKDGKTITMPAVLQDVLRDLIANARKYSDLGSTVEASLKETDDALEIVVKDNGIGIPEDQIKSVVNFGSRGENAADRLTKGRGFGLTKAWAVTKRFGGRMWIDSEVGKGTTVIISIPRADAAQSQSGKPAAAG